MKNKPAMPEFRYNKGPLTPDSMTPEEIIARLAEIEDIADLPLDDEVTWRLAAEFMELEHELDRLTDPDRKQPRH